MNFLAEASTWDDTAPGYVDLTMTSLHRYAVDAVARAELQPSWRALDVACGPGTLTKLAAPHVDEIVGVDFAEDMLRFARERLADTPNASLLQGDGQALPFEAASFDVAFSMFGLIFFPDRAKGFSELHRVLKPGARAHVSSWVPFADSPAMQKMVGVIVALAPDAPPPPSGLNLETPEQFVREMSAAGFVDVEVETLNHVFEVDEDVDAYWPRFVAGSAPILAMKKMLPPELWAAREPAAKRALADSLAGGEAWDMPALLATGRRP